MNEDFFDWLDQCPTNWFLTETNEDFRSYKFVDNDIEEFEVEE